MKKLFVAATCLAALTAGTAALACEGHDAAASTTTASTTTAQVDPIKKISVDELAARLESAKKGKARLAVFDVNGAELRQEQGIVPSAVLLPSSSEYDLTLLPKAKDTPVVFYCAAEKCGASKAAAKKAVTAGYSDVSVMPAGIMGWVKAGKPTDKPSA